MPPAPTLGDLTRQAIRHDWTAVRWDAAWYVLPVNAAALWLGSIFHQPRPAMVVVGAAVTVGFGAFHQVGRWRVTPMLMATLGFAISTWIGAVLGRKDFESSIIVTAIWGLMLAIVTDVGQGAWWVALQCMVALCISGAYPDGMWPATQRAMLVIAGGVLQIALMLIIWTINGQHWITDQITEPIDWKLKTTRFGFRYPLGNPGLRYTVRVTLVMMGAATINYFWKWGNGYWIPMTAATVLKTDFRTTYSRGIARLLGTIIGASAITLLTAIIRPTPAMLSVFILISLMLCFSLQRVNYGLFAIFITAYVVLLLALAHLPEPAVALRRTIATFIGGGVALGSFAILAPGKIADKPLVTPPLAAPVGT